MKISKALRSGYVRRWHSNPDMSHHGETLAEHQWSVVMIALHLKPDLSREGIIYALTHDMGEIDTGDLGYNVKQRRPDIAALATEIEHHSRAETLGSLTPTIDFVEYDVVKAADWFAAAMYVARTEPWLLQRSDWQKQMQEARKAAEGVAMHKVVDLVNAIYVEASNRGYTI